MASPGRGSAFQSERPVVYSPCQHRHDTEGIWMPFREGNVHAEAFNDTGKHETPYSYCVIFSFTAPRCCRRQHGHLGSALTSRTASCRRMLAIECGTGRSGRTGSASRPETGGECRCFDPPADELPLRGEKAALGDQKAVGCDAQAGMMMEAAPVAALVVAKAELLLEFLIVPLDPPARLGDLDQALERGAPGQVGEPVFRRLGVSRRP